jgi:hypothetical protein
MKRIGLLLILAVMMAAAVPIGQRELKTQYREVLQNWENVAMAFDAPYKNDWITVGVRYKYNMLKDYIGIEMLEQLSGQKVFLASGAHTNGLNLDNTNAFGHYNPQFVSTVHESLISFLMNDDAKESTQIFYNNNLQMTARSYYLAHQFVNSDEIIIWQGGEWTKADIIATYQGILNGSINEYGSGADFLGEIYRSFADTMEADGYNWYEADTAPGFWIRRSIDGTDDDFIGLLNAVLEEVDASW